MREGERYALMPYELEQRDGVPGINVQQQIQQYGKPEDAVIPAWLKAEHLYGIPVAHHTQKPTPPTGSYPYPRACGNDCGRASNDST